MNEIVPDTTDATVLVFGETSKSDIKDGDALEVVSNDGVESGTYSLKIAHNEFSASKSLSDMIIFSFVYVLNSNSTPTKSHPALLSQTQAGMTGAHASSLADFYVSDIDSKYYDSAGIGDKSDDVELPATHAYRQDGDSSLNGQTWESGVQDMGQFQVAVIPKDAYSGKAKVQFKVEARAKYEFVGQEPLSGSVNLGVSWGPISFSTTVASLTGGCQAAGGVGFHFKGTSISASHVTNFPGTLTYRQPQHDRGTVVQQADFSDEGNIPLSTQAGIGSSISYAEDYWSQARSAQFKQEWEPQIKLKNVKFEIMK